MADTDGSIKLPQTDSAMTKIAPTLDRKPEKVVPLGKKKKKKDDDEILDRAKKRMQRCISAEESNRKAGLEDRKFEAGDQWDEGIRAKRNNDNRPCHTANKIPTLLHQVVNDIRQNRPQIYFVPVGDKSDRETAQMLTGLSRQIHRKSMADIAYDTAVHDAASNGWGYWRVITEYESDKSFDQIIRIRRIRNPFSVYLDPNSQEPDGADARFAFISELVPREEFEEEWPNADPIPYDLGGVGEKYKEWVDKDTLRIAEYFEIENKTRTLVSLSNGFVGWKDELHELIESQIEDGTIEIMSERDSQEPIVMHYKITAKEILDRVEWPGKWIPIVKLIADEVDIEGKVTLSGVVRHAKSSQQMLNYYKTMEIESVALAPKAPWLVAEGQIEGYEAQWDQANTKSFAYLPYRPVSFEGHPVPPPQRNQSVAVPAGIVQGYQAAGEDMQATTGIRFDGSMREKLNNESGKAIKELGRRGDLGSYHIADNLSRSMIRTGAIIMDLIPKVYDARRIVTILREDDKEEKVQLDPHAMPGQQQPLANGKSMKVMNPTLGEYDVAITVGPSHATRRQEAEESMFKLIAAVPSVGPGLLDIIARMADWPNGKEIEARLAKMVPPQLMAPDQKDMSPQIASMLKQMQQQLQKAAMEKQQLLQALNEKKSDRALIQDKTNKDFEAKLFATMQKQEAVKAKEIGSKITDMAEQIKSLMAQLAQPQEQQAPNPGEPQQGMQSLMGGMDGFTGEAFPPGQ